MKRKTYLYIACTVAALVLAAMSCITISGQRQIGPDFRRMATHRSITINEGRGGTALITATGFIAYETVEVRVYRLNDRTNRGDLVSEWTVEADPEGVIDTYWGFRRGRSDFIVIRGASSDIWLVSWLRSRQ